MDKDKARQTLTDERERLEALRATLDDGGRESQEDSLSELSTVDQHPADTGSETFERTKDLSLQEELDGRLADVARALEKLDDGSYGTCEVCGKPIEADRLEVLPAARLCFDHQVAQEGTAPVQ